MIDPFEHLPSASPQLLPDSGETLRKGRRTSSDIPQPQTFSEARLLSKYWRDPRGGDYYQGLLWAMQEFRNSEKWPKARLQETYNRRYAETQELLRLLDLPDGELEARGWDGAKWFQMWLRSRLFQGRLAGMLEAMMSRR